jgi:DNA repair protein RecO (recombination protein O)
VDSVLGALRTAAASAMGLVETEAIVLRTYRLAEADKIVICLTEKAGLVRGVAAGARRLKSRYGASLEPFTFVQLIYFEKEGRELVTLKGAEIIRSHFALANDPEVQGALDYFGELTLEFSPPSQVDERLYRMVRATTYALAEEKGRVRALTCYFELWMLRLSGFLPDLRHCAECRRDLRGAEVAKFMTAEGSLRCGHCAAGEGKRLEHQTYMRLASLQSKTPAAWAQEFSGLSTEGQRYLTETSRRFVRRVLEKEPRHNKRMALGSSTVEDRRRVR